MVVDLLRLVCPEWNLKRLTSRLASGLLIVLMSVFAVIELGLHIFYFVPLFPDTSLRTEKVVCHCVFAYLVWINMTANYYYCITVQPGTKSSASTCTPSKGLEAERLDEVIKDNSVDNHKMSITSSKEIRSSQLNKRVPIGNAVRLDHENDNTLLSKQDKSVSIWTPRRSGYCKVCQAEIAYKDHHCPFTGNCVGLNNYSYFFLALVYSTVGLGYSLIVVCLYFGDCVFPTVWSFLKFTPTSTSTCSIIEPFAELFLPGLGGFVVLNIVLLFQVFLLLSDLTTYEVLKNFWKASVFKVGFERIQQKMYLEKGSRLNMLLLSRRTSVFWFLLPVQNLTFINDVDHVCT